MEVENPVWGEGGGVTPEKLLVVYSPLLKTLTLFMTKVCDIFYPLSVSGFQWPDQKFDTLFKKNIAKYKNQTLFLTKIDTLFMTQTA